MSLVTKIADLATRIGTEFKTVRTEISTAQSAAESYADGLATNYDPAGSASAAQSAAESYADGLAVNYDPAGSASQALADAQAYADALTTDDVSEGVNNQYFTEERVQDVIGSTVQAGSNISVTYDDAAGTFTIDAASGYDGSSFDTDFAAKTTDDLTEGAGNLYFTDARAQAALDGLYDPAGSASTAETNAASYTDTAVSTAINDLVNGAPSALDTLNELSAALGNDANYAATISTALGNRVRVDAEQSFNPAQKIQARSNIDAASATDVGDITSADFAATFEAALV